MITIWKFPIEVTDEQVIEVPRDPKWLTVQTQAGTPCLWALVNTDNPKSKVTVKVVGTGHDASKVLGSHHVGTFQIPQHGLVFHVFAEGRRL